MKDTKIDLTASTIINKTIPVLKNVTLDRPLEVRRDHRDSLQRFRTEMGMLATEIEGNYWDEDFERKIRDEVDLRINPVLQALEDSTESFKDKLQRAVDIAATTSATRSAAKCCCCSGSFWYDAVYHNGGNSLLLVKEKQRTRRC